MTQFYFGFYSAFSGQPLYEQFIYQLYNITMTSLPIMWYAVFDFEKKHEKMEKEEIQWPGPDSPSRPHSYQELPESDHINVGNRTSERGQSDVSGYTNKDDTRGN